MHSIRRSEEIDNSTVLAEKLKAARLRRCNMIFDGLCPDHNDTIYLHELESHFRYLNPDSSNSLWMFFQAFRSQTKKESMNRKYFILNMLTALEKNKFNLHLLFQDCDIVELENRIARQAINSQDFQEHSKRRADSEIFNEGVTTESTQRTELPLQGTKESVKDHSPCFTNRREYPFQSHTKVSEAMSFEEKQSVFVLHESQRDSQKKLQEYLKRNFDTELLDPYSQREIINSVIVSNGEESQIVNASNFAHKKIEVTPKKIPTQNHRSRSIPSTAEIELNQCTFEPKLHKPLRSVIRNEIQPKIYEFMLKNKFLTNLKLDSNKEKSFSLERQKNNSSPYRISESFIPRRSLPRNSSSEGLSNMSLINLGYADAHYRKIEYAQQHLIPEYIELKTRRKSLEKQNSKQKPQGITRTDSSARLRSKQKTSIKEVHLTIESLQEKTKNYPMFTSQLIDNLSNPPININESLELRKKYYASRCNKAQPSHPSLETLQTLERSNSRLSTHESNKIDSTFLYGGHYISTQNLLSNSTRKRQISNQIEGNKNTEEKLKGRSLSGLPGETHISLLGEKSVNTSGLQDFSQNLRSRKSSKSKLDLPLKKNPTYHIKSEGPQKKNEKKEKNNKENSYNFSFTDRDLSQSQFC